MNTINGYEPIGDLGITVDTTDVVTKNDIEIKSNILIHKDELNNRFKKYIDTDDSSDKKDVNETSINKPISLLARSIKLTFETLKRNLASVDYKVNFQDSKYITKTYYLEDNKVINMTVDMHDKKKIITTIDGDTGYSVPLVKTEVFTNDKTIDVTYS